MAEKETKTNAMRFLEKNKLSYRVHTYPCDGFTDGVTVAKLVSMPVERVFKTLVTQGKSEAYLVFVIPVAAELDLKKAAKAASEKAVYMIPVKDITTVTGYIRGGCSPIGMKKQFKTIIDTSASLFDTILFSGGKLGVQIEMDPKVLKKLLKAEYEELTI